MNELLAQFLEEADELLGSFSDGLLALERAPSDAARLNEVFRAVHTLKGNASLFDTTVPLRNLLHAAEDVLDAARESKLVITSELVDALMPVVDLASSWLAELAEHEVLPGAAEEVAARHASGLRALLGQSAAAAVAAESVRAPAGAAVPEWVDELIARCPALPPSGLAVRYVPAENCMFRGEDPLQLVRQLADELVVLSIAPRAPLAPIDELDAYSCQLSFSLVTTASSDMVESLFRYVRDELELYVLEGGARLDAPVTRIVRGQLDALLAPIPEGQLAARVAAAESALQGVAAMLDERAALAGAAAASRASGTTRPLADLLERLLAEPPAGPPAGPQGASPAAGEFVQRESDPGGPGVRRALRVDQAKIDALLELAGELVVAKNALPFLADRAEHDFGVLGLARAIRDHYGALDRLVQELQASVMDLRMLPVSTVFQRFPRLVRDVAHRLEKKVELVTDGEETRADKDVLEHVADPLVHLVRNSLDHGIEDPAARRLANKPETATITLRAIQEADAVIVEVSDDGQGIDAAKLRDKAVSSGAMGAAEVAALSDEEALDLVFLPGLSTKGAVSELSGRGVGMDAVRTAVQRLGGRVGLESTPGQGTTVRLRLPLTMAVTRVMVVGVGGQRFGVPIDRVQETSRRARTELGSIAGHPTLVHRGDLVPLMDLAERLELADARKDEVEEEIGVLVVESDAGRVGLVVDRFHGNQDIILKPLEGVLASCHGFAGAAMLGDGDILLVLDLEELVDAA